MISVKAGGKKFVVFTCTIICRDDIRKKQVVRNSSFIRIIYSLNGLNDKILRNGDLLRSVSKDYF
jgi:hypothetical protein